MDEIPVKRGETLGLEFQFFNDDAPYDVGNVGLSSQVRTPDGLLVAALTLVKQETVGLVTAQVADTSQWPAGRLRADIRAVVSGQTVYSETFAIMVTREVSRAASTAHG